MTIYTTMRPEMMIECFGESYNPKTSMLKKPSSRRGWKIEQYYYQEVKESDLFIMMPDTALFALVELLDMDGYSPMYLTVYTDEKPEDSYFKEVGTVCESTEVLELLPHIKEFSNISKKYTHIPSILSSFLDIQDEPIQKKTNHQLTPSNNPSFYPTFNTLVSGMRDIGSRRYIPKFNTLFFREDGNKYYCLFTLQKVYLFADNSSNKEQSMQCIEVLEQYIDTLFEKSSKTTEELEKELDNQSLKPVNIKDKQLFMQILVPSSTDDTMDEFLPIPISDKQIYQEFYFFIQKALHRKKLHLGNYDSDETEVNIAIGKSSDPFDKADFYARYTLFFRNHPINPTNQPLSQPKLSA